VIQFTARCFGRVHKCLGLTDGFSNMESSLLPTKRQANSRRLLRTAFLIYGIMVVGLLGFFIVFPDTTTHGTQGEDAPLQTAAKATRYEGVIANWNRYRARDARAEAR
jgi:D-alanyl-lipoteichoic acid acyltransferase DltB (MBOAT superfamily)